jgi:hypothetical protein
MLSVRGFAYSLSLVVLSGCGDGLFASRETNPVIEESSPSLIDGRAGNLVTTYSTTASYRSVIIRRDSNGNPLICSEGPPDVSQAIASAVAASLQASAKLAQGNTDTLSAQYAQQIATQVAPLVFVSQGLQKNRDEIFNLCIDSINGKINDADYQTRKKEIENANDALIKVEIPYMQAAETAFLASVKANAADATNPASKQKAGVAGSTPSSTDTSTTTTTTTTTSTPPAAAGTPAHTPSPTPAPTKKPSPTPAPTAKPSPSHIPTVPVVPAAPIAPPAPTVAPAQ